jgi:hypothetical protein
VDEEAQHVVARPPREARREAQVVVAREPGAAEVALRLEVGEEPRQVQASRPGLGADVAGVERRGRRVRGIDQVSERFDRGERGDLGCEAALVDRVERDRALGDPVDSPARLGDGLGGVAREQVVAPRDRRLEDLADVPKTPGMGSSSRSKRVSPPRPGAVVDSWRVRWSRRAG